MAASTPKLSLKLQVLIDKGILDRLPITFSAYWLGQIREWELLFPAEQSYYERLFSLLDRSSHEEVVQLFESVRAAEQKMRVNDRTWPKGEFTIDQVDFLNRNPHYPEWRAAVARLFTRIDPVLDAEIASRGHARLVVVISPGELPIGPDRLWSRIGEHGRRISVQPPEDVADFVPQLLTGASADKRRPPIGAMYAAAHRRPYDSWMIEAGTGATVPHPDAAAVKLSYVNLSYTQLASYRRRLMSEVNHVLRSENIAGPRQLGARLKQMKILPSESALAADPVLAEFTRATLLSGNGTLLINNTFVEWTTVQAVRRARPSVAVITFGIRNKVKPFSSLLIYADQEAVTPVPTQMDTLGTYVDLEVFYQYIWQEFEKYVEYRRNTVYVFAAEGMDQIFVMAPQDFSLPSSDSPRTLPVVHQHLKAWVNLA